MAVATYEDVEVALGRLISTEAEQAQVEWWLSGVELLIISKLGPVADLDQDVVKYVEVEAVAAKVRRGATGDASSITVTVDDGGVTRRYENPVSADDITDEWWGLLDPDVGGGAFSVRPYFVPDTPVDLDDLDWS